MEPSPNQDDVAPPPPFLVVVGLTAILLVCSSVGSVVTLFLAWRAVEDAMLGWAMLGVMFGLPFVGFLGAAAVDADRRIGRPLRGGWWLVALGFGLMGHWAPVALWPLVLLVAAVVEPHRFEEHGLDAMWAMGAVAAVGLGLATVQLGRSRLARPVERLLPLAERPHNGIAASIWSGITVAWGSAILSMVWLVFMVEDGWNAGGMSWLLTWAFGVTALATTYGGWIRTIGATGDDALRGTGSALFGQAVVPFVFALSPALSRDPELQYAYLFVTAVLATMGAFVWGFTKPAPVTTASGSVA